MARLFEYQSKELLKKQNIPVPSGKVCQTPKQASDAAREINKPVAIKAQTWFTGRAAVGGIGFAENPEEASGIAKNILGKTFRNFMVGEVLVEEKLSIKDEMFASITIDDLERAPVLLFSLKGGSGIEKIARDYPESIIKYTIDINSGLRDFEALNLLRKFDLEGKILLQVSRLLVNLVKVALAYEARSVEINPIAVTEEGKVFAADCRITVDDYAVFRHPDLGITYARELDAPPTPLDKLAYSIEKDDYRGTFYFIQLEKNFKKNEGFLGFHGAGGGGSMMSMDAIQRRGYKLANFCDTSGNPPASKVYRAAKIILSQKGIDGYFGSGSGVASQEQIHSARGLVKAFLEENLNIPAVIRLGGNMEEKAVEILQNYTKGVPAPVEGYTKDDSADYCAERMDELLKEYKPLKDNKKPEVGLKKVDYEFETVTGSVKFQYDLCMKCSSKICIESCEPNILKLENGVPVLAVSVADAKKGKCTECLGCELECRMHGEKGCYVNLPVEDFA
ncbi:acetate--CoA ligase family protein [candidate division KSB1 bacterium]|nr:acetate--CoA ligase family protein [candidate division KSB1 bacterium]